jgi:hypothetical protein
MDGILNRESMTADLESMRAAGLGNLILLEVNDCLSDRIEPRMEDY